MRRVRLATIAFVPVVAAVVFVTADADSTVPLVLPLLLVAVTGFAAIGGVVAAERMLERRMPTADSAAGAWHAHGFMQVAIAEFPLLLAVALAYVMGPPWVVLIGAAAALAALVFGAPTTARARRLEDVWDLPTGTLTHGAASGDDDHKDDSR